jgi:hypothetical protein
VRRVDGTEVWKGSGKNREIKVEIDEGKRKK